MSTAASKSQHSFLSYLDWEERQSQRHELIDGEVFAMTGGSTAHGAVGLTLLTLLKAHLKDSRCRVFWPDVKVKVGEDAFYPDIKVSCVAADLANVQYIAFPIVIVEILSPTTEDYDRGRKFDAYRRIPELREYVLINPDTRAVELRRRRSASEWEFEDATNQRKLRLESIDFACDVTALFEDMPGGEIKM
jgi:Uma2 family endonuclease